ncbi:hypothetical protein NDS46_30500 (plasmid) [Paenibacillus thiaminolyticus]|uniref:hypothetical protein n=1 Tax=Paenibacillus thiaminolyticus TaxID=49283 RepID=UPI0023309F06|nr:hypothetical protein [Paenibacillus thiaminolyticus]WCF11680.1 hypothetical protein NDS46_30500 [Paenibacillus thiaminolyticus]
MTGEIDFKKLNKEYQYDFEAEKTLSKLYKLREDIYKPFITNSGTLNNHFFDLEYSEEYTVKNHVFGYLSKLSGQDNFWEICNSDLFSTDLEWNEWRNRGAKYPAYSKFSLKPEYTDELIAFVDLWIEETKSIIEEMKKEEERKLRQLEEDKAKFIIKETFSLIHPKGGEEGRDGYFDGIIECVETGRTMRIVARNVFDVGFYAYPKHVEGTESVIFRESWTEDEKLVCNWICRFSPFMTSTRM